MATQIIEIWGLARNLALFILLLYFLFNVTRGRLEPGSLGKTWDNLPVEIHRTNHMFMFIKREEFDIVITDVNCSLREGK